MGTRTRVPTPRPFAPAPAAASFRWLGVALVLLLSVGGLYGVWVLYLLGQPLLAILLLALVVAFAVIFTQRRFYASRFIYPGVAAILIFVAFPVVYTVYLGFTNYSFLNLLTYERAHEVLTSRTVRDLATGSGLVFEGLGAHRLKGLPEDTEVFRVKVA